MATRKRKLKVRASIHLPSLGLGQRAVVDPDEPYIAGLIESGVLVPLEPLKPRDPEPDAA